MVTDEQVRLLRQKRTNGKSQGAAAAAVGMSVRTARDWERGPLPSQTEKKRGWRTRHDPVVEVWDEVIVPLLRRDEDRVLQVLTILELLEQQHPGQFGEGQLCTLQRRNRTSPWPHLFKGRYSTTPAKELSPAHRRAWPRRQVEESVRLAQRLEDPVRQRRQPSIV